MSWNTRKGFLVSSDQRAARIFGVLFLITFGTSIPAYLLFQPVLDDPAGYIADGGKDNQIYLGALLELLLIIANVGTAVVLYPIARRQNEILALGYVAARIIECVFLAAGIVFVLGVVSLRQDSPDAADLAVSLAALKDWTFLFGPRIHCPLRERADPRLPDVQVRPRPAAHGLALPGILVIPEFLWELSLGIYAAVWGFRASSPILRDDGRTVVQTA
jgi:hypothetical protein